MHVKILVFQGTKRPRNKSPLHASTFLSSCIFHWKFAWFYLKRIIYNIIIYTSEQIDHIFTNSSLWDCTRIKEPVTFCVWFQGMKWVFILRFVQNTILIVLNNAGCLVTLFLRSVSYSGWDILQLSLIENFKIKRKYSFPFLLFLIE